MRFAQAENINLCPTRKRSSTCTKMLTLFTIVAIISAFGEISGSHLATHSALTASELHKPRQLLRRAESTDGERIATQALLNKSKKIFDAALRVAGPRIEKEKVARDYVLPPHKLAKVKSSGKNLVKQEQKKISIGAQADKAAVNLLKQGKNTILIGAKAEKAARDGTLMKNLIQYLKSTLEDNSHKKLVDSMTSMVIK
ncbi:hypothetical protein CCR75_006847 [Bremia lactucae]|uniref:Uncharacterized protein n=1 Tax=Bremia lactucae TaxID=4779 RepID=A0A976IL49_BRELC|nr:hypothetical protein CCR75_006847 [Bremia lactucae]